MFADDKIIQHTAKIMKRLAESIIILSVICGLIALVQSCRGDRQAVVPSSEFAAYVSAYTGGVVPADATIRVELAGEQQVANLGDEVKEKLFSFSPALKGKTYWVDNKTLEFAPDSGALKSGELYNARFALSKVMEIADANLREFEFSFRVEARDFALKINSIELEDEARMTVVGTVRFSDTPEIGKVEKMLSVRYENETLTPSVEAADDPHIFRFTVGDILRRDKDNKLEIKLSGKSIGIDKTAEETVVIPAINRFELMAAEIVETPEHSVRLTFSSFISENQDLTGIVTLEREGASYEDDLSVDQVALVKNNQIFLFFERTGNIKSVRLKVDAGLKNADNIALGQSISQVIELNTLAPQVEFLSSGSVMPDAGSLILPFRAVGLYAVDVKVIRIFENNVMMFLQDNKLDAKNAYYLRRAGRLVYKKMLRLDSDPTKDVHNWEVFSLDLGKLIKQEPGAIYRVELSFNQNYASYPCDDGELPSGLRSANLLTKTGKGDMTEADEAKWDKPEAYYYDSYDDVDWSNYVWTERENPCHPTYYMLDERKAIKNVLATNLGVIVKANSNNKLWVSVADILTASPVKGAEVKAYSFQLQPLGEAKTDANGFAVIETKQKPFILLAVKDKQKTYLRLVDGEENMVSRFDVGGKSIEKGLKGYIYGERGVWRPGDTLHVAFMLEDRGAQIPDSHPVTIEMYNPRGQFHFRQVSSSGLNGLYAFDIPTKSDDPTGMWNAYVKVGGATFHKSLRIETIKPNRLKINLDVPDMLVAGKRSTPIKIHSSWLTGAIANNLKTSVEMFVAKSATRFGTYDDFIFDNPATDFTGSTLTLFEGRLDNAGDAAFNLVLPETKNAPGMLRATLLCNVFEQGGDASIFNRSVPLSPYEAYVGIRFNVKPNEYYLETDADNVFDVVTVDSDGKPVSLQHLDYKIYNVGWSWWWDHGDGSESFASYINNKSVEPIEEGSLTTTNGKGTIKFRVNYPNWGRYLVYVKDRDGGHATGGVIYVDWPSWRGRSNKTDPSGLTMLAFSMDKTEYEVGEDVKITIPSTAGGRALVAIENGSEVISREWVTMAATGDTEYKFKTAESMTPNVYVHISLLQPHNQTANDLPVRMYGVMPVFVKNQNSILRPQIVMDDVLRPEAEFSVNVKETSGKPMTYTLAVVDDGLLDLTNFKTPDPWNEFYAREALGIRTWDMYDLVMGSFAGKYGSLFSIGGDDQGVTPNAKANRFSPVVKFIGPFALKKGGTNTHKLQLPSYVGSVRVMLIAGQDGAYGNAEKTVPVRAPLMILPSLPRVVSVNEEIDLPVNVFVMENTVKDVAVKVETTGLLKTADAVSKSVSFSETGDKMVYFKLRTGAETGVEKVTVTATGNGHTSKETVEIDVRNPNPAVIVSDDRLIEVGQSVELAYNLNGDEQNNQLRMEVSRIPDLKISQRFDYLADYPHYCSEQLTSAAFPLLFLEDLKDMDEKETATVKINIRNAIKELYGRQLSNGGFAYWSGAGQEDIWITSYAGNFLVVAKERGYEVNQGVLNNWKSYQRRQAQNFRLNDAQNTRFSYYQHDLEQAYRLYTLALAGSPELGAMNRMKELKTLSLQARWRLAAAYALAGKKDAAEELIFGLADRVDNYTANNSSYGSSLRDEAMILETLVLMGRDKEAFELAQRVAYSLSHTDYYNTQSVGYSLLAIGRMAQKTSGALSFNWSLGDKRNEVKSAKAVFRSELPLKPSSGKVRIENTGSGAVYASVIARTRPLTDSLPPRSNNIRMDISYVGINGAPVDVSRLKQGADFVAVVRVTNMYYESFTNLALTHIIPSGWEIFNERMVNPDDADAQTDAFIYRDIRDDRVMTYFDLYQGQTKEFRIRLMASYTGVFTLPAVQCEAMYSPSTFARSQAGRTVVEK